MERGKVNKRNKRVYFSVISVVLHLVTAGLIALFGSSQQMSLIQIVKMMTISVFFLSAIMISFQERYAPKKKFLQYAVVFGAEYILSVLLLMLSYWLPIYQFWYIGSITIGVIFYPYFGIAVHFVLTFLACIIQEKSMEHFVLYLALGIIICFLSKGLKKVSSLGYITLISIACNTVIIVLLENFNVSKIFSLNTICSDLSIFMVILCAATSNWMNMGYKKNKNFLFIKEDWKEFFSKDTKEWSSNSYIRIRDFGFVKDTSKNNLDVSLKREQSISGMEKDTSELTLKEMIDTDFILLKKYRQYSEKLYNHSMKVAALSKQVAKALGYDFELAYVGGIYHEIGRMANEQYIEGGILLGKEYGFPDKIVQIIKQHNAKYEYPQFPEAAIVMLADSIISSLDFMENKNVTQPMNQASITENIIHIRFSKGFLDEAGFTIKEYKELKEAFIKACKHLK